MTERDDARDVRLGCVTIALVFAGLVYACWPTPEPESVAADPPAAGTAADEAAAAEEADRAVGLALIRAQGRRIVAAQEDVAQRMLAVDAARAGLLLALDACDAGVGTMANVLVRGEELNTALAGAEIEVGWLLGMTTSPPQELPDNLVELALAAWQVPGLEAQVEMLVQEQVNLAAQLRSLEEAPPCR